jgi:hypothetical protein
MAHSEVIKNEFWRTIPYTSESKQATNSASVDDFVTSFCFPGSSSVVFFYSKKNGVWLVHSTTTVLPCRYARFAPGFLYLNST